MLGDDSLFRQGPKCLKHGIQEAVRRNDLIPVDRISPTSKERDSAALEVVKLHQLVITDQHEENLLNLLSQGMRSRKKSWKMQ